jgi:hypothetical protein
MQLDLSMVLCGHPRFRNDTNKNLQLGAKFHKFF